MPLEYVVPVYNRARMRDRGTQTIVFLVILVVWIVSFFLPSVNTGSARPGYIAAAMSMTVLYSFERSAWGEHLYLGSFWIANLFMLAAPFGLWRVRIGKGGFFLALMVVWDLLTLSYAGYAHMTHKFSDVLVGYFVWEAVLVAMTLLLFVVRLGARRTRV
jgi:hypothetical protein